METVFPYGRLDRGKPDAIIVDRSGRRFVNESDSYHHVVLGMFPAGAVPPDGQAFIVCDEDFIRRYGLGLVKPAPFPFGPHVRSGYLKRDATLAGLAAQRGVDPQGLGGAVRGRGLLPGARAHAGRDRRIAARHGTWAGAPVVRRHRA